MGRFATLLAAAQARNNAMDLSGRQALIVGGTSGVGEAVARKLAGLNANVCIVGRNEVAAKAIVAEMDAANPDIKHSYRLLDASLLNNVVQFTDKYKEEEKELHYLVVCAGALSMKGRQPTSEGVDIKLALNYYSRFTLMNELAPLMYATSQAVPSAQGEEGKPPASDVRAMTILNPGMGVPVPNDDLGLVNNYSIKRAADFAHFNNDLLVDSMSKQHPSMSFTHINPGIVDTNVARDLPWYARGAMALLRYTPLMVKPAVCAEFMTDALLNPAHGGSGFHLLSNHAEVVPKCKYHTEDWRKRVWDHTLELVGGVVSKFSPTETPEK